MCDLRSIILSWLTAFASPTEARKELPQLADPACVKWKTIHPETVSNPRPNDRYESQCFYYYAFYIIFLLLLLLCAISATMSITAASAPGRRQAVSRNSCSVHRLQSSPGCLVAMRSASSHLNISQPIIFPCNILYWIVYRSFLSFVTKLQKLFALYCCN